MKSLGEPPIIVRSLPYARKCSQGDIRNKRTANSEANKTESLFLKMYTTRHQIQDMKQKWHRRLGMVSSNHTEQKRNFVAKKSIKNDG